MNTINLPLVPLFQDKNLTSEMTTQALYGENFDVIKQENQWMLIRLKDDDYIGWIFNNKHLLFFDTDHVVSVISTWVYNSPNIKSKPIMKLFCGSKLKTINYSNSWVIVEIFDEQFKKGYIPKNHLVKLKENLYWIKVLKQFENVPYLWGGKTSNGIDCSGLLQLAVKFIGLKIPRDTKDQKKYFKKNVFKSKSKNFDNFNNFKIGDIIFWEGHVAIIINKNKLIHANAHHMTVKIEPIAIALKRIDQEFVVKRI